MSVSPDHPRPETLATWSGVGAFLLVAFLPPAALAFSWLERVGRNAEALSWAVPSQRGWSLLGGTVALSGAVAVLATLLGLGAALWMYAGPGRLRGLARRIYLLPLLIPPYLHALAWTAVIGRRQMLEQAIALVVGSDRVTLSGFGPGPTVLVLVMSLAPIVTLLTLRALEAIEPELMEQAKLLRPPWPCARRVLLPLIAPAAVSGGGLVFVLALVEYGVPSLFQVNVSATDMYAAFAQDNDAAKALASLAPLVAVAVVVLAGSQLAVRSSVLRGSPQRPFAIPIPSWPFVPRSIVAAGALAAMAAVAVPVAVLLLRGGDPATFAGAIASAPDDIARTLLVATLVATLSAVVALPVGLALVSADGAPRALWLACALPIALPGPLTGIGLVYLQDRTWLDWSAATPLPLVWAHAARLLPFAVYAASTQLRRIDPLLIDAASLHPVGLRRSLLRVRLPLMAPALLVAWLVVFVLSLGEVGATLLVAPPGQGTLPIRIFDLMHYGASGTVAALALALLAMAGIVAAAAVLLGRRFWPWTT